MSPEFQKKRPTGKTPGGSFGARKPAAKGAPAKSSFGKPARAPGAGKAPGKPFAPRQPRQAAPGGMDRPARPFDRTRADRPDFRADQPAKARPGRRPPQRDGQARPAKPQSGYMPNAYQHKVFRSEAQHNRFGPSSQPEYAPHVVAPEAIEASDTAPQLLVGRNPIREALKSGRDLEKLLVSEGDLSGSARQLVAMAREAQVIVQTVDRRKLDQMAANHQGLIAVASAYQYATVEDMLQVAKDRGEAPFIVALDQVTDPHNLGAVIRSAVCAGAHGVIIPLHRAVGLTPAAVKASAGGIEYVKVARVTNLGQTIQRLKKDGFWAYGADMVGEAYRDVTYQQPTLLVVGSEGDGISPSVLKMCDVKVAIPIKGALDSLNASVAAGILMMDISHKRSGKGNG